MSNLITSNLEDILFDIKQFNSKIKHKEGTFNVKKNVNNLGYFNVSSKQIGNICLIQQKALFKQDTIITPNEGIDGIVFYFIKQGGGSFGVNNRTKSICKYPSNTINTFFSHKDYTCEKDLCKKDVLHSNLGLSIPLDYFKNLVDLYPDLFGTAFSRYQRGETFLLTDKFTSASTDIIRIMMQIENSYLMGNCTNAYCDAKVLELLSLQFQPMVMQHNSYNSVKHFDKIKEAEFILLSDLHNPPSLKKLALQVGLNEFDLRCGFKEFFQNTVYGYLFEHKMQLAEQLLQNTHKTISEIAIECGYEYPSHFCTAFKRKFGVSPKKLRENVRK